jgi:NitT/TauT family transport system ATP-binding protein
MDIQPGEFISVVGPSSYGDSTLLMRGGWSAGAFAREHRRWRQVGEAGPVPMNIAFRDHLLLDFRNALDNTLRADIRG